MENQTAAVKPTKVYDMVLATDSVWEQVKQHFSLTNREVQVGRMMCQGDKTKQIQSKLDISDKTVSSIKNFLYKKIDAQCIEDCIRILMTEAIEIYLVTTLMGNKG